MLTVKEKTNLYYKHKPQCVRELVLKCTMVGPYQPIELSITTDEICLRLTEPSKKRI
jgi:hypothetical protein